MNILPYLRIGKFLHMILFFKREPFAPFFLIFYFIFYFLVISKYFCIYDEAVDNSLTVMRRVVKVWKGWSSMLFYAVLD